MANKSFYRGLALVSALALAACAQPPQQEMKSAQGSLDEAKAVGGESYAPESYTRAQQSMSQAKAEMDAQAGKFRLMQNYDRAKKLVAQAKADADKVKEEAAAGKVQAQQDAQASLAQAKLDLDGATAAVAGAPVAKDSRADVETMKGELAALKTTLAEAQTAFSSDDFATARQKADKVKQEAAAISADVARAVHKTKKR